MKWVKVGLIAAVAAQLAGLYLSRAAVTASKVLPTWRDKVVHALLFVVPAFLLRLLTRPLAAHLAALLQQG